MKNHASITWEKKLAMRNLKQDMIIFNLIEGINKQATLPRKQLICMHHKH